MPEYRIEKDLIGEMQIDAQALYGIHTARAVQNFPLSGKKTNQALINAFGLVKTACAKTNQETFNKWPNDIYQAIYSAAMELADGKLYEHIMVDALQGGAGTSTNMNVNEVIANRALQTLGKKNGQYEIINPIEDVNLHQSTNDTYPTALKVAAILELRKLEKNLIHLIEAFQEKEKTFADVVKVGRTQLQDAVLTTMGWTMSAFADAIARDRWRIYKCEERLRVVNLGGTAIGSGLSAPRRYIFKVTENLKTLSGIGLARAENMVDATQNNDAFVEVSGILNALAANILKISGDLRLMSSGPDAGFGELKLPAMQAGSSIMPGKVNPVIPEAVSQVAITVFANNTKISTAAGLGNFELNAFMPLIAESLLESIQLLSQAVLILADKCVKGLKADSEKCKSHVNGATATLTSLIDKIGYDKAEQIAADAAKNKISIKESAISSGFISLEDFEKLTSPEAVTVLGSGR